MKLERKPGIGFVANFTDEQIAQIEDMKKDKRTVLSKKSENELYNVYSFKRMGYLYIKHFFQMS
mgnify:CR=1 FL=1